MDYEPVTYFRRWGFSINEGGTPANIHASWGVGYWLFAYVYLFGLRAWFCIGKTGRLSGYVGRSDWSERGSRHLADV